MAMPLIDSRSLDDVFYPESDGEPMAESAMQAETIRMLVLGFQRLLAGRDDVFVGADQFWYPVQGEPTIVVAPDTLVVVGMPRKVPIREIGSYRPWEHGGHLALAAEVLSPSNTRAEMARKRHFYDRYGVDEYWQFDPESGDLEVWLRTPQGLRRQAHPERGFISPTTGVALSVRDHELIVHDPDGGRQWLWLLEEAMLINEAILRAEAAQGLANEAVVRADEAQILAEAERTQAEVERTRADAERARAQTAEDRVRELEALLADRGGEASP